MTQGGAEPSAVGTGASSSLSSGPSAELAPVAIAPNLIITNESGNIQLQWPVEFSNYMLEASGDVAQPFTMFGYSELTNEKLGIVSVTITNPLPRMFFRLRKP